QYLYVLGEADARIALLAVGLDPGLGFLHVDPTSPRLGRPRRARSDPTRPRRLRLAAHSRKELEPSRLRRTQRWDVPSPGAAVTRTCTDDADVGEAARSGCRACCELLNEADARIGPLTPLTQSNRSAGRRRKQPPAGRGSDAKSTVPRRTCQTCGAPLGAG